MYQLIYASSASAPMSQSELVDLLAVSRRNNARLGLTGLLLYRDAQFLQALEGEREQVMTLYQKILLDPRQQNSQIIAENEPAERDFPEWSMGFRNLETSEIPAGFSQVLSDPLNSPTLTRDRAAARLLLRAFRNKASQPS